MRNVNIPIYRAKKIDTDEYVEGYYIKATNPRQLMDSNEPTFIHLIVDSWKLIHEEIDSTTLAIHFPSIHVKDLYFGIDNKKGASIIEAKFAEDNTPFKGVAMHAQFGYVFYDKNDDWVHISNLWDIKVIGIQE